MLAQETEYFCPYSKQLPSLCFFLVCVCGGCRFRPFDLSKKWVIFLLLNFMNSLYILETSPLSDIHFAEIFLLVCVLSFYSLNTNFDRAEKFNFNESLSYCFFFQGEYF